MLSAVLLIGVVVAVGGAVVAADRLLASAVVRRVRGRIGAVSHAESPPVVRIGGTPFLTQLIAGRYRDVEVSLAAFTAGGMDFTRLEARLSQVRAPLPRLLAGDGVTVGRFTAEATIPLSALDGRLPPGLALRLAGGELLVVSSILPMPVAGVLTVTADAHQISLTPTVLGVPSLVGFTITLPPMPPRLAIDSVEVSGDGLRVHVSGDDVILAERSDPRSGRRRNSRRSDSDLG